MSERKTIKNSEVAEEFERLLALGQIHKLPALLQDLSDGERQQLAPVAIKCHKKSLQVQSGQAARSQSGVAAEEYLSKFTTVMGLLMTCSVDQLSKFSWHVLWDQNFEIEYLERVKPLSLRPFGSWLLEDNHRFFGIVRDWMSRDLIDKPTSDAYIIALIGAPSYLNWKRQRPQALYDWLLVNPDILDEDIWRFFEVSGSQENSLASQEKYSQRDFTWSVALKRLADEGQISRDRLLQGTLDALARGFIQFRSTWFSRFHEELNPTTEERTAFAETYGKLLGSPIPTTVSFAIKALQVLDKTHPLPESLLRRYFAPCLISQQKATVVASLSTLERAVKRNKDFAGQACMMAAEALQHESPELQGRAASFLKRYGDRNDGAFVAKLSGYLETAAPSVSIDLRAWLAPSVGTESVTVGSVEKTLPDGVKTHAQYSMVALQLEGWPLACMAPIAPIETPEELLKMAAFFLEHSERVGDLERVIDGAARLSVGDDDNIKALSAPLAKRAEQFAAKPKTELQFLFARFVRSWLGRLAIDEKSQKSPYSRSDDICCSTLISDRFRDVLLRVKAGKFLPLLSTPTHRGGWIEPAQILRRQKFWDAAGVVPDDVDLLLAMMRIPVDARAELASAPGLNRKLGNALRYLVGEGDRLEDPEGTLSKLAQYARPPVDPSTSPILAKDWIFNGASDYALILWRASALPSIRECEFAVGVRWAAPLMDWPMEAHNRAVRAYFELLLESGAPLERRALIMMTIGLIIGEAECENYARDAMLVTIDEGRLDTHRLGREISAFMYGDRSKCLRLSKSLAEVARVGELHADAVRQVIEHALPGGTAVVPTGFSNVLELLHELLAASGMVIQSQDARNYLESVTSGGKTGALIKKMLRP